MVNADGSKRYDHNHDGGSDLPYCSVKFRDEKLARARITLVDGSLTVETTIGSGDDWKQCLKLDRVQLPTGTGKYYMGFTAATGQVHDEHEIVYVMTNKLEKPGTSSGSSNSQGYYGNAGSDSSSSTSGSGSSSSALSWSWILVFLVCCVGFGAFYYNRALSGNPLTFESITSSLSSQKNKNF